MEKDPTSFQFINVKPIHDRTLAETIPHSRPDDVDDDATVITSNTTRSKGSDSISTLSDSLSDSISSTEVLARTRKSTVSNAWTLVQPIRGTPKPENAVLGFSREAHRAAIPPSNPRAPPTTSWTRATHANYYDALTTSDEDSDADEEAVYDSTSIVVDSGASDHFGTIHTPGTNPRPTMQPVTMVAATGDRNTSIGLDTFNLPLPPESLDFHVFKPGDLQRDLLSVGKACDSGLQVLFTAGHCYFFKDRELLLQGARHPTLGLYLLPRQVRKTPNPKHLQFRALGFSGLSIPYHQRPHDGFTIPKMLSYLHACAGYPVTSTWIQAIRRGYFVTWPGLTASRVSRYLPKSAETVMGHLKLVRQGTRSTTSERQVARGIGKQRKVMVHSFPTDCKELKGIMGTDQTGRFPVTSARGHKYLFIMCDADTNYIQAIPIKSRSAGELTRAFDEGYTELVKCGFQPLLEKIDNETSKQLLEAIEVKGLAYQTVPPGNHRQNPAERAVQTFKNHFISVLQGVDDEFPADQWDRLIPQANITLNLLRPCTVNEFHSAYAYIHGIYDFNAHPLAPLGCKAIVHQRTIKEGGRRTTWDNHGKIGYYIGPNLEGYRSWDFYIPETGGIQDTDTAEFFPKTPLPKTTVQTEIMESLDRIESVLNENKPEHTKILSDDGPCAAIRRLRAHYRPEDPEADENLDAVNPNPNPKDIATDKETAAVPRVKAARVPRVQRINAPRPKQKQKYPLGTRVRVREKIKGKWVNFIGEAIDYDPIEGNYKVEFEDGEWDMFTDDEMGHYRLVKNAPKHIRPATYANQLTVPGFFPKASPNCNRQLFGFNAGSIYDEELQKWMAYRDLIKHPNPKIRARWNQAGMNEFARLAQGHGDIEGMNVVTFIARAELPNGKKATYARYVVDYRPEKDEPWRLRITCGGDQLEYVGNTATHSASMETIKLQLNNIISSPNARAATGDISNMYLGSDLPEAEYVRFRLDLIPPDFIEAYKLRDLATPDGFVYARVNKAWYGLKQAGKIAHDDLVARLAEAGYKKAPLVEGYFTHETRSISFTLVVDDFLIKYERKEDLEHLREAIGKYYTFKVDEEAKQYVGIHLNWDYTKRTVRLSMDGYVKQALLEFQHPTPKKHYYAPSRYTPPSYGQKVQFAKVDETAPLTGEKINFIQRVVGKLLYYARAVDPTMLHALNDISISAAKGTEATLEATIHLLNYAASNPDAEIIYRASDMILRVDSDAAYLVAPQARSRAGGYQYLSNKEGTLFNGPVLVLAKVIKNVMTSAAEAEVGALFMNAQEAAGLRNCLEAMGYPQPATPMKTDNSTACGIMNNTMKQKRSKAMDVRFYWLRDRAAQGQFYIYWESGAKNFGDFHTKVHPPSYHKVMRAVQTYIEGISPDSLQGCVRMMNEVQTGSKKISLFSLLLL